MQFLTISRNLLKITLSIYTLILVLRFVLSDPVQKGHLKMSDRLSKHSNSGIKTHINCKIVKWQEKFQDPQNKISGNLAQNNNTLRSDIHRIPKIVLRKTNFWIFLFIKQ